MTLYQALDFPVVNITPNSLPVPLAARIRLVETEPYLGDASARSVIQRAADEAWDHAVERGRTVFNRPGDKPGLVRCLGVHEQGAELVIDVQPTWFWTLLGTNLQIRAGAWAEHEEMVAAEKADASNLAASKLANCLSVNLTILSADVPPKVLVQRRARGLASSVVPYQCSAAGFVDFHDVHNTDPGEVAATAAVREAQEETGLRLDPGLVSWLALGRDQWAYGVGLAGFVKLAEEAKGVRLESDETEVQELEWWDFTPHDLIAEWKRLGYWYAFVPLGGFSMLATLAYIYGEPAVVGAWTAVGGIAPLPRDLGEPQSDLSQ